MAKSLTDWRRAVTANNSHPGATATAQTFIKDWNTASHPVLVEADDGHVYVLKGRNSGRQAVNDQIVGRAGRILDAPVGDVHLIAVPAELVAAERRMAHVSTGLAHATVFCAGFSERAAIDHVDEPENRPRFALLSYLFGLFVANDHQFIYSNVAPHLVVSVDHGRFLPGGPDWNISTLQQGPPAEPDSTLVNRVRFSADELAPARVALRALDDDALVRVICAVPDDWGITLDERAALAEFLSQRRDQLL